MLNLQIQTLDGVEQNVREYVATAKKKGHNPTIHGIYGYVRKLNKYSFFGDYPLLHEVLVALKNLSMVVKRQTVASCANRHCQDLSGKFTGKRQILEELYKTL